MSLLYLRADDGKLVPLDTVAKIVRDTGARVD